MAGGTHRAEQHRSAVAGMEAVALASDRTFPRHAHDQFGIGVLRSGAQRSWSGVGAVEAVAGEVITVNPGELHDGMPVAGRVRAWRMLYLDPALVATLAHLFARYGGRALRASGPLPFVARARQRLDEAPELPVTLAELAALSGVSRFQLLRGFARAVGTTPHAYLRQNRVRLARRLLAEGHRPAEAAVAAGFADQSHLTRAFARQLGITPARYRAALA